MTDKQRFSEVCNFTAKQWEATHTAIAHRFTLFGGYRGPGKSYWLRWHPIYMMLRYAAQEIKGVSWGLFCETYPELQDRHVSKIANEFPAWLGELVTTQRAGLGFYLKPKWGGGVLLLRNLDAPDKYKSAEFAGISIDEITRIPKRTVDILRGSLRWPGIERPQFCAATNPDGKHHEWVRQLWVERNFTGEGFDELAPLADEFAFVPAKPGDNPHLSQSYWNDLLTAPRDLREAWLEGNWYSKAFGVVYDEFDGGNIEDIAPDFEKPFELAFDDGYIDPRVVLFIQRSGTTINVFDEQWQTKTLDDVSVKDVLTRCATWQSVTLPDDWSAMKLPACAEWLLANGVKLPDIAVGGSESVQLMRRFKEANIPARGGTHEIVEGIKIVRRLIKDGNGYRTLKVAPRCKNLIGELTQGYRYPDNARRDSEKPEDANNHGADALRLWLYMRAR
jgi:hypothetical protein